MISRILKKIKKFPVSFFKNKQFEVKEKKYSKEKLSYKDIFISSGEPIHTYYSRNDRKLEEKITEALSSCKLTVVEGPTKAGKTVLVRKILPKNKAVWVNGGSVSNEDDFWDSLVEQLSLYQIRKINNAIENHTDSVIEGGIEAGLGLAKTKAKTSVEFGDKESSFIENSRQTSSKITVLKSLELNLTPIVIDDFHFVPLDVRNSIIGSFKNLMFDGLSIVVIAVRSKKRDVFKMTSEMTGRISTISVPLWTDAELVNIPQMGFDKLGCSVSTWQLDKLTTQALGTPHLIQDFCYELCKSCTIKKDGEIDWRLVNPDDFENAFSTVAEGLGRRIFEELVKVPGQKISEERLHKVHKCVLGCIAQMNRVVPHLGAFSIL